MLRKEWLREWHGAAESCWCCYFGDCSCCEWKMMMRKRLWKNIVDSHPMMTIIMMLLMMMMASELMVFLQSTKTVVVVADYGSVVDVECHSVYSRSREQWLVNVIVSD